MREITAEDLRQHLEQIASATTRELDVLLHDLLVRAYPSRRTQDS